MSFVHYSHCKEIGALYKFRSKYPELVFSDKESFDFDFKELRPNDILVYLGCRLIEYTADSIEYCFLNKNIKIYISNYSTLGRLKKISL